MYKFFVGSDISKDVIDVAYRTTSRVVYLGQFKNNIPGFKGMIKELRLKTEEKIDSWFICFENTGVYSKGLLEYLSSQGIPRREENALLISKSLGIKRAKTDKIDSIDICRYAFEKRDSIQPSIIPQRQVTQLKKLLSRRELLVQQKVSLQVSLKEQKSVIDADLYKIMENGNKKILEEYQKEISKTEALIEKLKSEDDQFQQNYDLVKTVVGIGPIIGAYFMAYTQNFEAFDNARRFASFSGIAPFPNRSGKKIGRSKVSHMANKKIKSLLSNAANAAIMFDPEIKTYYKRKIKEGKEKGVVINAIKNKLVQRAFSVVKRKTPYVKIMNYAY